VYRLGQKSPIDVYNLVSEQGIESRIASLVGSKQAFFKGLFDGDSDSVHFDQSSSFLSKVEKLYENIATPAAASNGSDEEIELSASARDEEVGAALEPRREGGDESRDAVDAASGSSEAPVAAPAAATRAATAERLSDSMSALPSSSEVRQLFSQLKI